MKTFEIVCVYMKVSENLTPRHTCATVIGKIIQTSRGIEQIFFPKTFYV